MNHAKQLLAAALLGFAILLAGCSSIEKKVRDVPAFSFDSWAHSDRYGVFTDKVTISGAKWALNPDGSATLTIENYDVEAAWAGTVGPHDTFSKLVVNFPPLSPQATILSMGGTPLAPLNLPPRR